MKSSNIKNRRPSLEKIFSTLMLLLLGGVSMGQSLFTYHPGQPVLMKEQLHYLSAIKGQMETEEVYFVDVDPSAIKQSSFLVSDPYGNTELFESDKSNVLKTGSFSTFGYTRDEDHYRSRFFLRKEFMRGEFMVDNRLYALRPISGGMHVIYDLGDVNFYDCSELNESRGAGEAVPTAEYKDRDLDYSEDGANRGGGPDCRVRLICAYTTSVDNLEADIQGYIEDLVEYFNDANDNSLVPWHVELARSVEVAYTESDAHNGTRSTDLQRLHDTGDGFLEDVPTLRDLYDADMVMLFCDYVQGGSGAIGGQAFDIGSNAADAYTVMRYNNTATTFPHEFAHLHGCRHHDDGTTTPYAYGHGYDYVAGGWETLLSKNNCCSRIQNFSNPGVTNGGIATGTAAYYDNARVMEETGDDHHDFQTIVTNKQVWQDETVTVDEVSDFQGVTTLTNGTSEVEYWSGSTGTFRAGSSITLSEGFWARSGCDFTATIESCSNLRVAQGSDEGSSEPESEAVPATILETYPNPFSTTLVVNLKLSKDNECSVFLTDVYGKTVRQISASSQFSEGTHMFRVDVEDLASGMYLLVAQSPDNRVVKQVVRAK